MTYDFPGATSNDPCGMSFDLSTVSQKDLYASVTISYTKGGNRLEIFEYVMVMVSIILGLGVTQILRGLSKIARGEHPSSIVTTWAALLFTLHLQVWWALWDLHQVAQWTQVYFFFVVAIPCSLFAMTELLLPMGSVPETD